MKKTFFWIFAFALSLNCAEAAQVIREEVIPSTITRDSEINPTGVANAICISNNPGPAFNIAFCSTVDLTGKTVYYKPPEVTVATLPASHGLSIVTDGTSSTDCTVGGGATKAWCWWNGTAWAALPGSGGGGVGTITGVTAGTGLTGGGTSGAVALAVALSMRHTLVTGPPSPGSCQAGGETVIDTTTVVSGITGVPYWCSAANANPVPFSVLGDGVASITTDAATSITMAGATAVRVEGQDGIRSSTDLVSSPKRVVLNYKLRGAGGTTVRVWSQTGTFTNQPTNDTVELISSSASDTQAVTIWGTTSGSSDTVLVSETIAALTGTSVVSTQKNDWGNIYAVELASGAVGTVTIRKGNNNATISTIAPAATIASQAMAVVTGGGSGGSFDTAGSYTLTGAWNFVGASVTLNHSQLANLTADNHTQYTLIETGTEAVVSAAGACDRAGQIQFATDTLKVFPCYSAGGNPVDIADQGDSVNQICFGTDCETASGNVTGTWTSTAGDITGSVSQSGGVITTNLAAAAKLKTKSITFRIGSDTGDALVDTQDELDIWENNIAAMTITAIKCRTDQGTSTINLQRNDGSPADILSSNLLCNTTGATGTINTNEDNLAVGNMIDFVMVTAATSGTPKRITVSITATID